MFVRRRIHGQFETKYEDTALPKLGGELWLPDCLAGRPGMLIVQVK